MLKLLWLLLYSCICCMIPYVSTCVCLPLHPQQAYCNADFVIRAKVMKDLWSGSRYNDIKNELNEPRYEVLVTALWKGKNEVMSAISNQLRFQVFFRFRVQIYTVASSCSLQLKTGGKYILTGNMVENKMYITSCNWRLKWGKKAREIRQVMKNGFKCYCGIEPCFDQQCHYDHKTCSWYISDVHRSCKHYYCLSSNGVCQWSRVRHIRTC